MTRTVRAIKTLFNRIFLIKRQESSSGLREEKYDFAKESQHQVSRPYSGTVSRDVMTRTVRTIETLFSRIFVRKRREGSSGLREDWKYDFYIRITS
jgi:hypothetical protein